MVAEETIKVETTESSSETLPAPVPETAEPLKEVVDEKEKSLIQTPHEEKLDDDSKALILVAKPIEEKKAGGSIDRDAVLTRVTTEKRLSLIKAWEESEKSKVENKSEKKLSSIEAWENSKKASIELELKQLEEKLEKKKAAYIEKMKNKIALIHKSAEEKRANIEAKRGEEALKAEEMAAKYRATGTAPKKLLGLF